MTNLYIHIPFCTRKCPYCDFLSWPKESPFSQESRQEAYFSALTAELKLHEALGYSGTLDTVFIGGGTPTKPAPLLLVSLIEYLRGSWGFAGDYELTVETNPETLPGYPLTELARAGATRLSVGVQSTHSHHLRWLGRGVDWPQVKAGLDAAAATWTGRLSFDLLYGLPNQTIEDIVCDISRLLAYNPEHISAYQLTSEPGTPLARRIADGRAALAAEGIALSQQAFIEDSLARAGLLRYEISNYAAPGGECRHNVNVWNGEDYIGAGVGAMGFIKGVRYSNVRSLESYLSLTGLRRMPRLREESLDTARSARERVVFGLRMVEGIDAPADVCGAKDVLELIEPGLLEGKDSNLRIPRGKLHLHDYVASRII